MQLLTPLSHFLIAFVMFVVPTGCSTTSDPLLITPPFSEPAPIVDDLENLSNTVPPASTSVPSTIPDTTQTALAQDMIFARSAEETLVARYPRACELLFAPREFSPNGLWMVELCYSDVDQDLMLTFSKCETQDLWQLLYKNFIPQMDSMPDGGLSVVHWSNDGRYAYFYSYLGGDGGECYVGGGTSGSGLFRIDLQTGYTTSVLPTGDWSTWYTFSFSPTDRRLVYGVSSRDLKILNMLTGKLTTVANLRNFSQSGGYLWSQDGLQFVYSTVTSLDNWETRSYSLRLVNALSGSEQILLESPDNCFDTKLWSESDILTVESYGTNDVRTLIELDLSSNKIIGEVTTTPFP